VPTPFLPKEVLLLNAGTVSSEDVHRYQEEVGFLIWAIYNTRVDFTFSVTKVYRWLRFSLARGRVGFGPWPLFYIFPFCSPAKLS
jgi:hypothetical protein